MKIVVVSRVDLVERLRRQVLDEGSLYQMAIADGSLDVAEHAMRRIVSLQEWIDSMVPRAGIEPALLSETDFESAASTSSANGATAGEYIKETQEVKPTCTLCGGDCQSRSCPDSSIQEDWATLPQSTLSENQKWKALDFEVRVSQLLADVKLPNGWAYRVSYMDKDTTRLCFQIEDHNGVCNVTGKAEPWRGRKWPLSEFMTDGEIINTIWKAVLTAAEHELREGFKFKGVTIYDPHFDPNALVDFMKTKGSRTWRDDGMTEVA